MKYAIRLIEPNGRLIAMKNQYHQLHFYMLKHLNLVLTSAGSTTFIRNGAGVLAEVSRKTSQTTATFFGLDMARSPVIGTLHRQLVQQAFTPYGHDQRSGTHFPLTGFTGQPRTTHAQIYLMGNGHRAYATGLMRFGSPDALSPFAAGGINAYAYCKNDPTNFSDLSGRTRTANQGVSKPVSALRNLSKGSKTIKKTNPEYDLEFELVDKLMSEKLPANASKADKAGHVTVVPNLTTDQLNSIANPLIPKNEANREISFGTMRIITGDERSALLPIQHDPRSFVTPKHLEDWLNARTLGLNPEQSLVNTGYEQGLAFKINKELIRKLKSIRSRT